MNYTCTYNSINQPQQVKSGSTVKHKFAYLADGRKLHSISDPANDGGLAYIGSSIFVIKEGQYDGFESTSFSAGRIVRSGSGYAVQYHITDHLGSVRAVLNQSMTVLEQNDYYPFGLRHPNTALKTTANRYRYNGKEDITADNTIDYGARQYSAEFCRWMQVDPLAEKSFGLSPYNFCSGNPINRVDPDGRLDDWVERQNGTIYWDDNALSPETTKTGEKYLGKNVLVGTHNRDKDLNEPINSARFDLYLENDKDGVSATIYGNTIPSDVTKYGTLAEGLYSAKFGHRNAEKYKDELAIRIYNLDGTDGLPTVNGNPNNANSNLLTGILFHKGNNFQKSLYDSKGIPYSQGCQTSGNYYGSHEEHNTFMKIVGNDFKGIYYLRSTP